MCMLVSKNLKRLAKLFNTEVYLVGGCVRNALLGYVVDDVDIASKLTVEQVFSVLDGTGFLVKLKSAKMGTVEIFIDDEMYQHTTFRKDSYNKSGEHSPSDTSFGVDIKEDAKRRDFTINALYYCVNNGLLFDFYKGQEDLSSGVIRCVETAKEVFSADGLRLLRLVRFASRYNFTIEDETFKEAKAFAKNLKSISGERKQKELIGIFSKDINYSKADINYGIKLLFDLNLIKYILGFEKEYLNYEFYNFSPVSNIENEYRIYAFLLCFFTYLKDKIKVQNFLQIVTNKNALNFSNKQTVLLKKLINAFTHLDSIKNANMFVFKNYTIIDELLKMLNAFKMFDVYDTLNNTLKVMQKAHTPFTLKELKINGNDLIREYGISGSQISFVLESCLKMCVNNPKLNEKQTLLEKAKNFIN